MKASSTKHLHKQETAQEAGRSKVSPQGIFLSISHQTLLSLGIRNSLGFWDSFFMDILIQMRPS